MQTVNNQHTGALVLELAQTEGARPLTQRKRYWTSERISGVMQYWATVGHRAKVDHFGLQFVGKKGESLSKQFDERLTAIGFYPRNDTTGSKTFARKIPFNIDGQPDSAAIQQAKIDLDRVLASPSPPSNQEGGSTATPRMSFVGSFRGSLPFLIDLELPPRDAEPMREIDL